MELLNELNRWEQDIREEYGECDGALGYVRDMKLSMIDTFRDLLGVYYGEEN